MSSSNMSQELLSILKGTPTSSQEPSTLTPAPVAPQQGLPLFQSGLPPIAPHALFGNQSAPVNSVPAPSSNPRLPQTAPLFNFVSPFDLANVSVGSTAAQTSNVITQPSAFTPVASASVSATEPEPGPNAPSSTTLGVLMPAKDTDEQKAYGYRVEEPHAHFHTDQEYPGLQFMGEKEVSTIALVPHSVNKHGGKSIAANADYICYTMKGGRIRVIGQNTGRMTIVKGTTPSVVDLAFGFPKSPESLLLASVDNNVCFWTLPKDEESLNQSEISPQLSLSVLGNICHETKQSPRFHRVVANPSNAAVFAIASSDSDVLLVNVHRCLSAHGNEIIEDTRNGFKNLDGIHVLSHDGVLLDISYSKDGSSLACLLEDGSVTLWDVVQSPRLVRKVAHSNGPGAPSKVCFVGNEPALAIGCTREGTVSLIDAVSGHVFASVQGSPCGLEHDGPFTLSHGMNLLLVPCNRRKSILVWHYSGGRGPTHQTGPSFLATQLSSGQGSSERSVPQFDYLTEFQVDDDVVEILVYPDDQPTSLSLYVIHAKSIVQYNFKLQIPRELKSLPLLKKTIVSPSAIVREQAPATTLEESDHGDGKPKTTTTSTAASSTSTLTVESLERMFASQREAIRQELAHFKLVEAEKANSLLKSVSDLIQKNLPRLLEQTVNTEVRKIVATSLNSTISSAFDKQFNKNLTKFVEKIVSENVSSALSKPPLLEALSVSLGGMIKCTVEETFKESFASVLIPGMQSAIRAMLAQIHEVLEKRLNSEGNGSNPVINYLQTNEFKSVVANILSTELRQVGIDNAVNRAPVRRGSELSLASPQVEATIKAEINQDIALKNYEGAFTKALSTPEVALVVHVCRKIDIKEVFSPNRCKISQPVLLSLIHQITLDIVNDTSLKLEWLQECIVHLKPLEASIAEHTPRIISAAVKRLHDLQDTPSWRSAKILSMMMSGVGQS